MNRIAAARNRPISRSIFRSTPAACIRRSIPLAVSAIVILATSWALAQTAPAELKPESPVGPAGPSLSPDSAGAPTLPALPPASPSTPDTVGPSTLNPDAGIPPHEFGHLGITVVSLDNGDGLRIVGIEPTSPAFPAGLLIDDEITAINGKRITKFEDLVAGLRGAGEGDGNVSLLVRRRGTLDTINVMVGGKKAQTERPQLGVVLDDSNGQLRVKSVVPNSPALRGGVHVGDEIVTVNDYPVSTYDLFVGQIQAMGRAGGQMSLGVRRSGQMLTLHPTIGTAKAPASP